MSAPRLFTTELHKRPVLSRCKDLVPLKRDVCLRCGGELRRETHEVAALFFHGGYGATRRTTFALCDNHKCRWARLVSIDEVRPERDGLAMSNRRSR